MNKYEKVFMDIQSIFTDKGIFVEDDDIKVGFSHIELDIDDENNEIGDSYAYPENDDRFDYPIEFTSMSEFFSKNKDIKFVVTQDKARENKFMSWKEFCNEIDDADETGRKYDLDIFSM